jgi:hypothetical protein
MTAKKYAQTLEELADELGFTREYISRRFAPRPGFPKKTAKGYDVAAVYDFMAKDRKRSVAGDGSLKDRKLIVEIEILEAKRDEIRRTLIPVDEHLAEMQQFHQIGVAVLDQWISVVSSVTKDAAAVSAAENLRKSCIDQWRDRLEKVNA